MLIRFGYKITLTSEAPLPLITLMSPRPERIGDMRTPEQFTTDPGVPVRSYLDGFGNLCRRMTSPGGTFTIQSDGIIGDSGITDPVFEGAIEHDVEDLPDEVLVYLMGSRYCDTDLMMQPTWDLFGHLPRGWSRVQAIVDWVHDHIAFSYGDADATRTARNAFDQGKGVCRDFAHLAIAMCRCLNIPARYVNGHLGDIGVPDPGFPMDFSAWMEVYLSGRWWTFDPRNNAPRIGRIVLTHGRDAADVPMINSFGAHRLDHFEVWTDAVDERGEKVVVPW